MYILYNSTVSSWVDVVRQIDDQHVASEYLHYMSYIFVNDNITNERKICVMVIYCVIVRKINIFDVTIHTDFERYMFEFSHNFLITFSKFYSFKFHLTLN